MSNEKALSELKTAEKDRRYNIIYLCEPHKLPELHRLIVETVQLNDDPNAGDIYYHTLSKKWGLHHQGKLKLAMAAAIEWDTIETKPVVLQRDYIHYQAVGQVRREYGRILRFRGDYEFDLESLKEDLFDAYVKKANSMIAEKKLRQEDKDSWVRDQVKRDYSQKRQHRLKLAATGAKSVVIDKLLNLKSGYKTKQEAAGPFVIVRCQVAPDLGDPTTRAQLSLMALQSVAGIFGTPPQAQIAHDIIDVDPSDMAPEDPPMPEGPEPPMEPPFDPGALPFDQCDDQTQRDILTDLAKSKRYDLDSLQTPIEKMGPKNRQRFYDHLTGLEAA